MKIKPCPFCGKHPDSEAWVSLGSKPGSWRIGCTCMGSYCVRDSKIETIKIWNKREFKKI